jgi:hypothetical protein
VQSFDLASLEAVKALAPGLPTAWLWVVPPAALSAGTVPAAVDVMAPAADHLAQQPGFVASSHATGHDVHTWTVDDPDRIRELVDLGVDGVFTNRPAVARAVVDRAAGAPTAARTGLRRGCPPGGAVRVAARAADAAPADDGSDGSGAPLAAVGIGAAALAAVAAGAWWLVRRRRGAG